MFRPGLGKPLCLAESLNQEFSSEGAALQFLLCPRCRVSQLGCCAGEEWFSVGESELGFMVISLLPPSSGCVTAADSQCAQAIL